MKTYPVYTLLPYWHLRHVNQTCDGCPHYEPFSGQCFHERMKGGVK